MYNLTVTDLGAVGDGIHDDTAAFELAIRKIEAMGGGCLVVPGCSCCGTVVYNIRPINLTSHMELYLESGAEIKAIANPNLWPIIPPLPSYGQGRDHPGPRYTSLLHAQNLTNVTIRGQDEHRSVVNGNGKYWWELHKSGNETITRGHLVEFMYSTDIRIQSITLKDSPFWTTHIYDSDTVHIRNVHVVAPAGSPNTDGFDPDSARNVWIEDSTYFGGDDCVAIKSGWDCFGVEYGKPSVNITMRNLTCVNQISIGSEISGGVQGVWGEQLYFPANCNEPLKIKSGDTRGGYIQNITFRDVFASGTIHYYGLNIDMTLYSNEKSRNPSCPANWTPPTLTLIRDLSFSNLNGTAADFTGKETFHLVAYNTSPLENMYMEDVYLKPPINGSTWVCDNVYGTIVNGTVSPWPPCDGFNIVNNSTIYRSGLFGFLDSAMNDSVLICVLAALVYALTQCWRHTKTGGYTQL